MPESSDLLVGNVHGWYEADKTPLQLRLPRVFLSWGPSPLIVRGGTTDSVAEENQTFSYGLLPVSQVSYPSRTPKP